MKKIKQFLKEHSEILSILSWLYRLINFNKKRVKGSDNLVKWKNSFMKHNSIEVWGGRSNVVEIGALSKLNNCRIYIRGNNNHIKIGRECVMNHLDIWVEDDGNSVEIGCNTWITGETHIAVTEGTAVKIGERCLFSDEIAIRTGDSHSILNEQGVRINKAKGVEVGNHVWIGNRAMLLKGTEIGDDSVVGAGAIVTEKFGTGVIVAGVPGKVIKEKINWDSERHKERV